MKTYLYLRFGLTYVLTLFALAGCASSGSMIDSVKPLDNIRSVHAVFGETGSLPTIEQYQFARESFVSSMEEIRVQQATLSRAPAHKIKNGIALAGAALGLGGTVASFIVDDKEKQATIAQTGGLVASVTTIIGFLPIGQGAQKAKILDTMLSTELPLFEERWPSDMEHVITPAEWGHFVHDAEHLSSLVDVLSQ